MSLADIVKRAPKYMDVVAAYDLDVKGGDLQLTRSGDLAVTPDGDLKFGDDRVNAMHRLIQWWCFNAPFLWALFELVTHARTTQRNLNNELSQILPIAFSSVVTAECFHEINEEIGANGFGGAACAGAIMVVLNNLLLRYKLDLGATDEKWDLGKPQLEEGWSLGSVINAGAANFRHHDEWARTNPPSNQQLRSIAVIAAVLREPIAPDGARHPFRHNVCQDLLHALTGRDFDQLGQRFFSFAKDLAK